MNISFKEVRNVFEYNEIWSESRELFWYEKAWEWLEKAGLTEYENQIDKTVVFIRAYTLLMIFSEMSELVADEYFNYEYADWNEHEFVSLFRIGQLSIIKDIDVNGEMDDRSAADDIFGELVESERCKVFDALKEQASYGVSEIFVRMYFSFMSLDEVQESHIEIVRTEEWIKQKYEKDIRDRYDEVLSMFDSSDAFMWICSDTYKLR